MIGDTAIFRNREAERSRVQNHPRSGTGRPSYSEARPPESENPHDRRLSSRFMPIRSDANRRFHAGFRPGHSIAKQNDTPIFVGPM